MGGETTNKLAPRLTVTPKNLTSIDGAGLAGPRRRGRANDQNLVTVGGGGWFAFFVATEISVLVGKILAERVAVGDDGEPREDLY